jgi:hypothetical protein
LESHDPERFTLVDENLVIESDRLPQTLTGRDAAGLFFLVYVTALSRLHFEID